MRDNFPPCQLSSLLSVCYGMACPSRRIRFLDCKRPSNRRLLDSDARDQGRFTQGRGCLGKPVRVSFNDPVVLRRQTLQPRSHLRVDLDVVRSSTNCNLRAEAPGAGDSQADHSIG